MSQPSWSEFWSELQRRKVINVAVSYAVVTFVAIQIADATFEALSIPLHAIPWMLAILFSLFPLALFVAWRYQVTPGGLVRDHQSLPGAGVLATMLWTSMLALSLGFAAFFAWLGTSSGASERATLVRSGTPTVAVLPFDDFSPGGGGKYLGDGIAEQLLHVLDSLSNFNVVGRTSSFILHSRGVGIGTIGDTLGADHVVEGSVVIEDKDVLVTVQVIDAESELHVWSKAYRKQVDNVIDLEMSIASEIANSMSIVLGEGELEKLQPPTEDSEAYLFYLRGKEFLRRPTSAENLESADRLFSLALREDPNMMSAEIGRCQAQLAIYRIRLTAALHSAAMATCLKILSVHDGSADAHIAIGDLQRMVRNFEEAAVSFESALASDQQSAVAWHGLARAQYGMGKLDDAERAFRSAIDADPGWAFTHRGYGFFLAQQRRFDEAIEAFKRAVELAPDDFNALANLALVYFDAGDWDTSRNTYDKTLAISRSPLVLANYALLEYYSHDFDAAIALLEEAKAGETNNYWVSAKLAASYREAGRESEATAAFTEAYEQATALLQQRPDDAELIGYIATFEANLGRAQEAERRLRKALSLSDKSAIITYYGAVVHRLNNSAEAEAFIRDAIRHGYSPDLLMTDPLLSETYRRTMGVQGG